MGPVPPGGELKEWRGSCIQGNLLTDGEIRWDRRRASGAVRGKGNGQSVASRTQ